MQGIQGGVVTNRLSNSVHEATFAYYPCHTETEKNMCFHALSGDVLLAQNSLFYFCPQKRLVSPYECSDGYRKGKIQRLFEAIYMHKMAWQFTKFYSDTILGYIN